MPQQIDPDSVNFVIGDLARLMRAEFERRVAAEQLGVTSAEARVLAHLWRRGPLRQTRLAELLTISPMSLTGFLDRLEAAGLVERRPDPRDGRAKQVGLTAAASPLLSHIGRIVAEVRSLARSGIDAAEWEQFNALATRMRDTLTAARGDGAGPDA